MAITYNNVKENVNYIYRATSGGTVFSANLTASTAFDLFDDSPTVNDCIYFGGANYYTSFSDLYMNIGAAMAGTDIVLVWEYYYGRTGVWRTMHNFTDNTADFTVTGANTVQFPFQVGWAGVTINGLNNLWIRCRLVSFTTVTEGGATAAITQKALGILNIDGYSDSVPCTFLEVYNWVIANAPQIGAHRLGFKTFKFDCCGIYINSRLRSTDEHIFIGCGCPMNGKFLFNYIHAGTKVGTDGWSNASYFFINGSSPGVTASFSNANAKVYGGEWNRFDNLVDGVIGSNGGYIAVSAGEHIGVYFNTGGYFGNGDINRCRFDGGIISAGTPSKYPINMQIANPTTNTIWAMYGYGLNIEDLVYALPGSALFYMGAQYMYMGQTTNVDNPSPAFPDQTSAPRVANRSMGSLTNLTACLFYDDSAGTYTDYLTQASSTAVDDVPINGDVGDCLYILAPSISTQGNRPALSFTISSQENDYEYAFEYYRLGSWYQIPASIYWDTTNNFTQTGIIYPAIDGANYWQNVTINGTSALWLRIRIVTKGTGTPMVSRIQSRSQTGITDLKTNERYTISIKVLDENGDAIENATVVIKDNEGTTSTLTTDSSGSITPTKRIITQTFFDPNTTETDANYKKESKSPFEIYITKTGYETYYIKKDITAKVNETIALKKAVQVLIDTKGKTYIKPDTTNLTNRQLIVDGEVV